MSGTLVRWAVIGAASLMITAMGRAQEVPEGFQKRQLKNGVTVLLGAIPGADTVAVETIYRVGFLNEPAGMTESAHLLEHMVCQSATKSYKSGESFALLQSKGKVNAETLPTFTHFDYILPASDLSLVLNVERERLTSLAMTREVIEQEAPKCRQEADLVEQNPKAGMLKHAFMAMSQAWRHGAVSVRLHSDELARTTPAALETFRAAHYSPANLMVSITGGVSEQSWTLLEEQLGALPAGPRPSPSAIDWKRLKNPLHVAWDAKIHAVCVSVPAPAKEEDRLILTLWGAVITNVWASGADLSAITQMTACSNPSWPVGELPFFLYAVPNSAADVDRVVELLRGRIRQIRDGTVEKGMEQFNVLLSRYRRPLLPVWESVQRQAKELMPTTGVDEKATQRLILGNLALQAAIFEMAPRLDKDAAPFLPAQVARSLRSSLDDARVHVTVLTPGGERAPK